MPKFKLKLETGLILRAVKRGGFSKNNGEALMRLPAIPLPGSAGEALIQ